MSRKDAQAVMTMSRADVLWKRTCDGQSHKWYYIIHIPRMYDYYKELFSTNERLIRDAADLQKTLEALQVPIKKHRLMGNKLQRYGMKIQTTDIVNISKIISLIRSVDPSWIQPATSTATVFDHFPHPKPVAPADGVQNADSPTIITIQEKTVTPTETTQITPITPTKCTPATTSLVVPVTSGTDVHNCKHCMLHFLKNGCDVHENDVDMPTPVWRLMDECNKFVGHVCFKNVSSFSKMAYDILIPWIFPEKMSCTEDERKDLIQKLSWRTKIKAYKEYWAEGSSIESAPNDPMYMTRVTLKSLNKNQHKNLDNNSDKTKSPPSRYHWRKEDKYQYICDFYRTYGYKIFETQQTVCPEQTVFNCIGCKCPVTMNKIKMCHIICLEHCPDQKNTLYYLPFCEQCNGQQSTCQLDRTYEKCKKIFRMFKIVKTLHSLHDKQHGDDLNYLVNFVRQNYGPGVLGGIANESFIRELQVEVNIELMREKERKKVALEIKYANLEKTKQEVALQTALEIEKLDIEKKRLNTKMDEIIDELTKKQNQIVEEMYDFDTWSPPHPIVKTI